MSSKSEMEREIETRFDEDELAVLVETSWEEPLNVDSDGGSPPFSPNSTHWKNLQDSSEEPQEKNDLPKFWPDFLTTFAFAGLRQ